MRKAFALALSFVFLSALGASAHAQAAPPVKRAPVVAIPHNHIYDEKADPKALIAAAFKKAKAEHKRVILDFGGDWCGDCQVLYYYFHKSPNAEVLNANFVLVPVWVGHIDTNLDLAAKYGAPLKHGVPALSVVDANGKILYAQTQGEFSDMRYMDEKYASDFLNQWKP